MFCASSTMWNLHGNLISTISTRSDPIRQSSFLKLLDNLGMHLQLLTQNPVVLKVVKSENMC